MKYDYSNLLVIYGNGRNVGKTHLTCALITKFSAFNEIIAIKISPHFHDVQNADYVVNTENFKIINEKNPHTGKDSSRMLSAGASKVYYVQCTDESISMAVNTLLKKIPAETAIICESGGLLKIVKPGLSLFIKSDNSNSKKIPVKDSIVIQSKNGIPVIDINKISFKNQSWNLMNN